MGFKDTLKGKLGVAKAKAGDLAQQHGGKIESGLDKAAHTVDAKTGGKYSGKIGSGVDKAKGALDNLKDQDHKDAAKGPSDQGGPTGPASPDGPAGPAGPAAG